MVKVKLLEPNPLVTSRKGLVHAWSRYYGMISAKLVQALIGYIARQAKSKSLKLESWGPKGTIVVNMELGDYLNVGT
jgi:hypothetical protein